MLDAKMKKTILAIAKQATAAMNDGILARTIDTVQPRDRYALHCAGVKIDSNAGTVTQHGEIIARIQYTYNAAGRITRTTVQYL